jgi:hypothetical protein
MPPAAKYAAVPEAPARAGIVPPLAVGFTVRTESVPDAGARLVPGTVVALVPGEKAGADPGGWAQSCGKTQLASYLAGALPEAGGIDFTAWVTAASRASLCPGISRRPRGWAWTTAATRSRWRPGSRAGWAAPPGPGWSCSTTCGTRQT